MGVKLEMNTDIQLMHAPLIAFTTPESYHKNLYLSSHCPSDVGGLPFLHLHPVIPLGVPSARTDLPWMDQGLHIPAARIETSRRTHLPTPRAWPVPIRHVHWC